MRRAVLTCILPPPAAVRPGDATDEAADQPRGAAAYAKRGAPTRLAGAVGRMSVPRTPPLTGALVEDEVCKTVNETSGRTVTQDPRCARRGVVC